MLALYKIHPLAYSYPASLNSLAMAPARHSPTKSLPVRFSSSFINATTEYGGYPFDIADLQNQVLKWTPQIERHLDTLDCEALPRQYPAIAKSVAPFGLLNHIGIPPALIMPDPNRRKDKAIGKSTHGAIAFIAMQVVRRLPAADTIEGGLAQVMTAIEQVSDRAVANIGKMLTNPYEASTGIGPIGIPIKYFKDRIYSAIQTKQIVFIGKNGAVQILQLPNEAQLVEMIRHDQTAQFHINADRPLNQERFGIEGIQNPEMDVVNTVKHLLKTGLEKVPQRMGIGGWLDVHTLLEQIPFDFASHIRAGRIKVIVDKPGANGESLWENEAKYPAP